MRIFTGIFLLNLLLVTNIWAQEKEYKVACIGFYNLENLFHPSDEPDKRDGDFTPTGSNHYTEEIYQEKLEHLSDVISQLGTDLTPHGVSILGVAEIENRKVLEDLAAHPNIKDRGFDIVHHESPDKRGIDVALLYRPDYYEVTDSKAIPVMIYRPDGDRIFTRDVLWVSGIYDGEPLHVFVNHWPSRRGGQKASEPLREAASAVCKNVVDSLLKEDPTAKILIMGDLNDDPINSSVKSVLGAKGKKEQVKKETDLYNPMWGFYKKGLGTLAYRDAWSLFDQVILSPAFLNENNEGFRFYKAEVFNKKFLVQKNGHFKGYPFRTYAGGEYLGGYSDHFPVFTYLIKEKK